MPNVTPSFAKKTPKATENFTIKNKTKQNSNSGLLYSPGLFIFFGQKLIVDLKTQFFVIF
jgi:hypothetical protein